MSLQRENTKRRFGEGLLTGVTPWLGMMDPTTEVPLMSKGRRPPTEGTEQTDPGGREHEMQRLSTTSTQVW